MKFGKRRQATDPPPPPPEADGPIFAADAAPPLPDTFADSWTVPAGEPPAPEQLVVEGEAVELPIEHVPAQPHEAVTPLTMQQPPAAMPFPAGEEPVVVVTADGEPAQVSSLADAGEAYASGHAAAPRAASPGPSWQEPVIALANERPEVVVGAAFAGGILAAMILRRLGS
jgi:hypothetical protein